MRGLINPNEFSSSLSQIRELFFRNYHFRTGYFHIESVREQKNAIKISIISNQKIYYHSKHCDLTQFLTEIYGMLHDQLAHKRSYFKRSFRCGKRNKMYTPINGFVAYKYNDYYIDICVRPTGGPLPFFLEFPCREIVFVLIVLYVYTRFSAENE